MEQCNGIAYGSIHSESSDKLTMDAKRKRRKQKGNLMLSHCVKGRESHLALSQTEVTGSERKGKTPCIAPSRSHR